MTERIASESTTRWFFSAVRGDPNPVPRMYALTATSEV